MAANCLVCGKSLAHKTRSHAKTCSARCRRALSRRSKAITTVIVAAAPSIPAVDGSPAPPDRAELLRRLDEQSRNGSVTATIALLKETPPERSTDAESRYRRLLALVPDD
jgi:hypothetical protein